MRCIEFTRRLTVLAPCRDEVSVLGKLNNAVIGSGAMPIGDIDVSIGRDDHGADRAQEVATITGHAGLTQDHQHVAVGTELDKIGTFAVPRNLVARPNVAVAVHIQTVRNSEFVGAERLFEHTGGAELQEWRDVRISAFVRFTTLEHPDALAVTMIHLDLDSLPKFAAAGQLRPAVLHLIWVGGSIRIGGLRVRPTPCRRHQHASGGDQWQEALRAHSTFPLIIWRMLPMSLPLISLCCNSGRFSMGRSLAASAAIGSRKPIGAVRVAHRECTAPSRHCTPPTFCLSARGSRVHGLSVVRGDYVMERRITLEEAHIAREPVQTSQ